MANRASNTVVAGAYEGKPVSNSGRIPFIAIGFAHALNLDPSTVAEIETIDESSEISVASAATRGFIGEMLFGPIGLAAAGTAKRNERYIVGIVFEDGLRSVLDVDGDLFRLIASSCAR
ncbi:hypothetical protein [Enorma massiliensis]|uniref:hypothetical protein n=1 Tax=Enorma massiliensis TaxID=1472761 RepID=UPI003AB152EC